MISYTPARTKEDLEGILALQKLNLAQNLSPEEIQSQGFVTVKHSYQQIKKLNDTEKHIVAKDEQQVVGYLLAMTKHSRFELPILFPMFQVFENILYEGKMVSEYDYIVIGQVCIDKKYRGRGMLDACYAEYKNQYSHKYDFAITEIAANNPRSLKAHQRIGFKIIHIYSSPDGTKWFVVIWNWKTHSQKN